jgi:hypothetical protein
MLSAGRGAGTKSQMLVAKIPKKLSQNKESVHFVGHSTGSEERDGRMGPIQGEGGYVNSEDLERARGSDGQTNRRTYERKETHILNLLTPTTARAQT